MIMRKIFYLLVTVLSSLSLFSQSPGGITGSVLWLKANSGASGSTWNDNSGNANHFTQSTPANQPTVGTNIFNFNPALQFNGTAFQTNPTPTGFPTGNNDRTIFAVANATNTTGFKWIFVYGNVGTFDGTCQFGNNSGGFINAFYASFNDITTANYWNAAGNANGALASFKMASFATTQYDRGLAVNAGGYGGETAPSANAQIGGLQNTTETWEGNIAEVIMFPSGLNDANRLQVESYLALKYGFTLGTTANTINYTASDGTTVFWTGNATYQNDVFGIGTDNGSALSQTQSNSMNSGNGDGTGQTTKGNVSLSSAAALNDLQFLMVGNDAGAFTEHVIIAGEAPTIAVGSKRVIRNWKVQNTGAVGAIDLGFDIGGFTFSGGTTLSNYRLMIDDDGDGDFNTGTQTFVTPSSLTGNVLNFPGVTLNNGVVFTIITQASVALPAIWKGFTAQSQKDNVILNWSTTNEVNVARYEIEHSTTGGNFSSVGKVAAKNNNGINNYSLTLSKVPAGTHYYRIRRVDTDGQSQLSETKSVRISSGKVQVLLTANPVKNGQLEAIIDVQQSAAAIIRIVTMDGQTMSQQSVNLTQGSNKYKAPAIALPAGTYLLQVQAAGEVINTRFIRQ